MIWPARAPLPEDDAALISLWHGAWHDAHGTTTPPVVGAARSPHFFAALLARSKPHLRVAGPTGAPLGLYVVDGDMLDHLFLAPQARGTGLATALLRDAENHLRAAGVNEARLVCVSGNLRAMRFYTRSGWRALGETTVPADGFNPPVMLDVTTFGKTLGP